MCEKIFAKETESYKLNFHKFNDEISHAIVNQKDDYKWEENLKK